MRSSGLIEHALQVLNVFLEHLPQIRLDLLPLVVHALVQLQSPHIAFHVLIQRLYSKELILQQSDCQLLLPFIIIAIIIAIIINVVSHRFLQQLHQIRESVSGNLSLKRNIL
jgi:hypothetical protein